MLIVKRHDNILQYKESEYKHAACMFHHLISMHLSGYCIGKASLRSICDQIRVEAVLYTLVRGGYFLGCFLMVA
jgi:hypothetical protein